VKQIEQAVLGRVYGFAIAVRRLMWLTLRPKGVGVRTLVIHNDQVLLIRHRAGATPWGLPGGGISRYERMIEAARREVLEETGVAVTMEYLLGLYDNFHDGFSNYIAVYVAKPSPRCATSRSTPRPIRSTLAHAAASTSIWLGNEESRRYGNVWGQTCD